VETLLLKNNRQANPLDIDNYAAGGGYQALKTALALPFENILNEVKKSRLVGRSAGFPVGTKWAIAQRESGPKYVVCDADEGEPGCFKDRMILSTMPYLLLEAMAIAGYAIGSQQGYIYIRGEYTNEIATLEEAVIRAKALGYLGNSILGTDFSFNITVYHGAGSYVVGEETALLKSMVGMRPSPRARPPYPAQRGFLDYPTVVNNVETLVNIPAIIRKGADWFAGIGNPDYPGTKLFCLSGHVNQPGIYELPYGVTLGELINEYGHGVKGTFKAALPGGVASGLVNDLSTRMDNKSLAVVNSSVGPGAVVVLSKEVSAIDISLETLTFFGRESCGKCSVCREGIRAGLAILYRFSAGEARADDIKLLRTLRRLMYDTANCLLGQAALNAAVSATKLFTSEFESRVRN
jgi:NADH-quinone oxidoreductase subunit F